MKKIIIGSYPFFHTYPDYNSHDKDYIIFEENPTQFKNFMNIRLYDQKSDTFYYRDMAKDEFIEFELKHSSKAPMAAGKFLIPELCKYKGITLEDLKLFESAFNNIDEKHKYEKIIYDAYFKNNGFWLTKEQRDLAYNAYKNAR